MGLLVKGAFTGQRGRLHSGTVGRVDQEIMTLQTRPHRSSRPSPHGFLPTLATGLTDQDRCRIEDVLDYSVSANTRVM